MRVGLPNGAEGDEEEQSHHTKRSLVAARFSHLFGTTHN